ncbi:hypothetical protein Aglo01_30360 [Actinokineospora globicatena]|nr:hypothetical protein Aglo01_30360 [Actinokineospora globicatena]GLW84782.1 hypothetical protein Aglo02_24220 [Actinokineospora globicatena]
MHTPIGESVGPQVGSAASSYDIYSVQPRGQQRLHEESFVTQCSPSKLQPEWPSDFAATGKCYTQRDIFPGS